MLTNYFIMIQTLFHTSENENSYIFDDQSRLSMLIHPELIKASEKSVDNESYYSKKYEYLKKYGFFGTPKLANIDIISESMVKESIIQTKQIVFEVTDSCNLRCTYCAYGELYEGFDTRNQKNINVDYAIKLLKYVFGLKYKNKNNKLNIGFYGGEPLLNIKFIKQIVRLVNQYKQEKELDVSYTMTTNATLIHKCIPFLVENKFRLLISLDGNAKNHSYRSFSNNKNSFEKVIENIDFIQNEYREYFEQNVNFNAVLHNRNSVKEIYEFIYSRYHKIPRISELTFDGLNPSKKAIHDKIFHSKRKSENEYQKEESNLLPVVELSIFQELSDFLKYNSVNFYLSNIADVWHGVEKYVPTSTCLPFQRKILLTTRGKLLACEKISYNKFALGEVGKEVKIDISEIVNKYNLYYNYMIKHCQNCYEYRFCGVCLFRMKNFDKLGSEDFVCDRFQDYSDFKNKLYHLFSFIEKYPANYSQIIENTILE